MLKNIVHNKGKKSLVFAVMCLLLCSATFFAEASPWPGYGMSPRSKYYKDDPAAESNYTFGVKGTYSPYRDPSFSEGLRAPNPLNNPDYDSYSLIIVVNKKSRGYERGQTLRAYQRGTGLIYYWYISTGMAGLETHSGYHVPQTFSSRHWSGVYDAPMLWSVFFYEGEALHSSIDSEALAALGTAYSHGCVHIEDHRSEELFHRIGHSGFGTVDSINMKTGKANLNSKNEKIKTKAYRTLIIVK